MGAARVAMGAVLLATPGLILRPWIGAAAAGQPATRLLARSVGGRDLALGLGTLLAASHGAPVRGWVEAGMVCDLGDAVATALASGRIPRLGAAAAVVAALTTAAAGRAVVAGLPRPADQPAS